MDTPVLNTMREIRNWFGILLNEGKSEEELKKELIAAKGWIDEVLNRS